MKFGGTSVGKPRRMHQIAELIQKDDHPKIVVLSALSGTTNALVEISNHLAAFNKLAAKNCIEELEMHYRNFIDHLLRSNLARRQANSTIDEHFEFLNIILKISWSESLNKDILAQGELMSTKLFSVYLDEQSIDHKLLPALDFMSIDAFEEPQVQHISSKLSVLLKQHEGTKIFITQGYICRNAKGEVDNLKRGGSDYTASLIAAAINASVCEIWTDISGMHNNDPRIVDKTVAIEKLSFDEAAELAYFGAKILHPACIWPAQLYNVPVKLLNTMQPSDKGTTITGLNESVGLKAVAAKDGITVINIKSSRMLLAYGFLRKIFEIFEKHRTAIDMITTSEVAVSVTIDNDANLAQITRELEPCGTLEIENDLTIVCIVGNEISQTDQILATLFESIKGIPVRMVSYGGSRHNISLLVPSSAKQQTLQLLNRDLFNLQKRDRSNVPL